MSLNGRQTVVQVRRLCRDGEASPARRMLASCTRSGPHEVSDDACTERRVWTDKRELTHAGQAQANLISPPQRAGLGSTTPRDKQQTQTRVSRLIARALVVPRERTSRHSLHPRPPLLIAARSSLVLQALLGPLTAIMGGHCHIDKALRGACRDAGSPYVVNAPTAVHENAE